MFQEEKIISTSKQSCEIAVSLLFKKNTEAASGGVEAVTGGVLQKKCS